MEITYYYRDIYVGSMDQQYIDRIADALDIDYSDAPIYPGYGYPLCNHIIDYIYDKAIDNLDISDELKETLRDNIYLNAYCSCIDIDIDELEATEDEKEKIKSLLSKI